MIESGGNPGTASDDSNQSGINHSVGGHNSSASNDGADLTGLEMIVNNAANIARGQRESASSISSPDEEVIRSRGRVVRSQKRKASTPDALVWALATRKSPRKLSSTASTNAKNDFAAIYFKSPTPKKNKTPVKKSPPKVPMARSAADSASD